MIVMEPAIVALLVTLASAGAVMGAKAVHNLVARRRWRAAVRLPARLRRAASAPVRAIGQSREGVVTVRGRVEAISELTVAPVSGLAGVAVEVVLRARRLDGPPGAAPRHLHTWARVFDLELDDGTGRALVRLREGAYLAALPATRAGAYDDLPEETCQAILASRDLPAWAALDTVAYEERVLRAGDEVHVLGHARREADVARAGYRELPTRLVLEAGELPVVIAVERSAIGELLDSLPEE